MTDTQNAQNGASRGQPSHLETYLKYYCSLEKPRYAVLVTGPWGSGKTHQVRNAIPVCASVYVSLFGLKNSEEIFSAVYAATYPKKALVKRYSETVGGGLGALVGLKGAGGLSKELVGAVLRQDVNTKRTIIFDDLERCPLEAKEILGTLNLYVEHHGCRVVVLAHEEELKPEILAVKEKLFGQTICVQPLVSEAFDSFLESPSHAKSKKLIEDRKADILKIFASSGVNSLRTLRHILEDISRLLGLLSPKHRDNQLAVTEIVSLLAALDIEFRHRRIFADDLRKRDQATAQQAILKYSGRKSGTAIEPSKFIQAFERYNGIDLASSTLQDQVLEKMIVEGIYDEVAIRDSLDASSHFVTAAASPPWQIVINFEKLDDAIVAEGLRKMADQLKNREVTEVGEILHVFALYMMMASRGILGPKNADNVLTDAIWYIGGLLKTGKLPPTGLPSNSFDEFSDAAYGVMYWVSDEYRIQFIDLLKYLSKSRDIALELEFPSRAAKLLDTLKTDAKTFYDEVCRSSSSEATYAEIPILREIDPVVFVETWLSLDHAKWRTVSYALRTRYEHGQLNNRLSSEVTWINEVIRLLKDRAARATGLGKLRIERVLPKLP